MYRKSLGQRVLAFILAAATSFTVIYTDGLTAKAAELPDGSTYTEDGALPSDGTTGDGVLTEGADGATDTTASQNGTDGTASGDGTVENEATTEDSLSEGTDGTDDSAISDVLTSEDESDEITEDTDEEEEKDYSNLPDDTIVEVEEVPAAERWIQVEQKTTVEDAIAELPEEWNVTLADGTETTEKITWTCLDDFDNEDYSSYVFEGSFEEKSEDEIETEQNLNKILKMEILFSDEAENVTDVPEDADAWKTGYFLSSYTLSNNSIAGDIEEEQTAEVTEEEQENAIKLYTSSDGSVLDSDVTETFKKISEYDKETYLADLSTEEKAFYNAISDKVDQYLYQGAEPMHTGEGSDYTSSWMDSIDADVSLTDEQMSNVVTLFFAANPQAFFVSHFYQKQTQVNNQTGDVVAKRLYVYLLPAFDTAAEISAGAKTISDSINALNTASLSGYTNPTDLQILKGLHDGLNSSISYDDTAVSTSTTSDMTTWVVNTATYDQSLASAFIGNSGEELTTVCAGYSMAYMAMVRLAGLDAMSITSDGHQWNKVKLYGTWFNVDTTWDDSSSFWKYFLVSDSDNKGTATSSSQYIYHTPEAVYEGNLSDCDYSYIYSIRYLPNGSDSISVTGDPVTYFLTSASETVTISNNSFTSANANFTGWNTAADGTGTSYSAGDTKTYSLGYNFASRLRSGETDWEMDLYAQWSGDTYTIQFDGNGATSGSMDDYLANLNQNVTLPSNQYVRTGYAFTGWNTLANGEGTTYTDEEVVAALSDTKDTTVTLYAQWSERTYTVTFDKNGKTTDENEKVINALVGQDFTFPSYYTDSSGWYKQTSWRSAADGSGMLYLEGDEVSSLTDTDGDNITFYPRWEAKQFKVSYISDDSEMVVSSNPLVFEVTNLDENEEIPLVAPETDTKRIFLGWYDAPTDGNKVEALTEPKDYTLYAHWIDGVQISFDANEPTGLTTSQKLTGSMPATTVQKFGKFSLPSNQYGINGYVLTGWTTKADGSGLFFQNEQDINFQNGKLTYTLPGDSENETISKELDLTTLSQDKNGEVYVLRLYAQWEKADLKITFDANGGEFSSIYGDANKTAMVQAVSYQSIYYLGKWTDNDISYDVANVTRPGYTLSGWKDENGRAYSYNSRATNTYTVGQELHLYAQWTPVVYYFSYQNTSGTRFVSSQKANYRVTDADYTIPALYRANYDFLGWYATAEDAELATNIALGRVTLEGEQSAPQPITAINPDTCLANAKLVGRNQYVYLYAAMKPYDYKIVYHLNASSDTTAAFGTQDGTINSEEATKTQYRNINTRYTFEAATRNGYNFAYWTTNPDGTGTRYSKNAYYTNLKVEAGTPTIDLYAQWTPVTYTVTYQLNGGSNSSLNPTRFTILSSASDLTLYNATKVNNQFLGWSLKNPNTETITDADYISAINPESISSYFNGLSNLNGNRLVLYAVFKPNTYKVRYHLNNSNASFVNQTDGTLASDYIEKTFNMGTTYRHLTKDDVYNPGYVITSWTATSSGGRTYGVGANFNNLSTTQDDVIDLYAVWSQTNYTIKYDLGGGNSNGGNLTSFNIDTAEFTLKKARMAGKEDLFDHWELVTVKDGVEAVRATIEPNDTENPINPKNWMSLTDSYSVTLRAVWYDYRIIYHENSASGDDTTTVLFSNSTKFTDTYQLGTGINYTQNGKSLTYWTSNANGTGLRYTQGQSVRNFGASLNQNYLVKDTIPSEVDGEPDATVYTLHLYAYWQANTYYISYQNMSGVTNGAGNPSSYNVNTGTLKLADPSKVGHDFIGWCRTPEDVSRMMDLNTELYHLDAEMEPDSKFYAEYSTKKQNGETDEEYHEWVLRERNDLMVQELSADTVDDLVDSSRNRGTNRYINLYPAFGAHAYHLVYHTNYGSGDDSIDLIFTCGDTFHFLSQAEVEYVITDANSEDPENPIFSFSFNRPGYTLSSWNLRSDGRGTTYYAGRSFTNLCVDDGDRFHVYAQWTPVNYTITYDLRNGNSNGGNVTRYNAETATFALKDGVRSYATFLGWYKSAADAKNAELIAAGKLSEENAPEKIIQIDPADWVATGNFTLYAAWKTTNYTLQYDLNTDDETATFVNSKGASINAPELTYAVGDTYKMQSSVYRKGYTLSGWNTRADGRGTTYRLNTNYSNLSVVDGTEITLYAVWTQKNYYITYNLRGGNVNRNSAWYYPSNGEVTLQNPTRNYATFLGWYTTEDAAKQAEYYAMGETSVQPDASTKIEVLDLDTVDGLNGGTLTSNRYPINLYAAWQVNRYNLTLDLNTTDLAASDTAVKLDSLSYSFTSGTATKKITVGDRFLLPTNVEVSRLGYTLIWNTRADGRGTNYQPGQSLLNLSLVDGADVTLYAKWTPITYTIRYTLNGGANDSKNLSTWNVTQNPISLGKPLKSYASFNGWDMKQGDTRVAVTKISTDTLKENDITLSGGRYYLDLTANWKPYTYTIIYHTNTTDTAIGWTEHDDENDTDVIKDTYQVEVNVGEYNNYEAALKRPGYTFVNWNSRVNGAGTGYSANGRFINLTYANGGVIHLYANWRKNNYTISYNLSGGRVTTANTTSYNVDSVDFTLNNPTKTNYDFVGWAITNNRWQYDTANPVYLTDNKISFQNLVAKGYEGNLYLLAVYKPHTYSITYTNGVTTGADTSPTVYLNGAVFTSQAITAQNMDAYFYTPVAPTRYGYTFAGWKDTTTNRVYSANARVINLRVDSSTTNAVELQATWRRNTYRVTYNLNGGSNSRNNKTSYDAETVGETFLLEAPTRTYYKFMGWYTDPDFKNEVATNDEGAYVVNVKDSLKKGNLTFYAKWQAYQYTINYTLGSGVDNTDYSVMAQSDMTMVCDVNSSYYLSSRVNRPGYTLSSWKDTATNRTYAPGNQIRNLSLVDGGTVTLEAVWTPIRYNITYYLNGGTNSTWNASYYTVPTGNFRLSYPTKTNYEFVGWYATKEEADKASADATDNGVLRAIGLGDAEHLHTIADDIEDMNLENAIALSKARGNTTIRLYAAWRAHVYSVTYHTNSSDGVIYDVETGNVKESPNENTEFYVIGDRYYFYNMTGNNGTYYVDRNGYTLSRWTTMANGGGTSYTPTATFINLTPTEGANIDLYAQWTAKNYSITYDYAGGGRVNNPTSYNVNTKTITLLNPTKRYATFVGWFDEEGNQVTTIDPAALQQTGRMANLKLTAKWTEQTYTVNFDINKASSDNTSKESANIASINTKTQSILPTGGSWTESTANGYSTYVYTLNAKTNTTYTYLPRITVDGYTLTGWRDTATNRVYTAGASFNNLSVTDGATVNLRAVWSGTTYRITYVLNGGTNNRYNVTTFKAGSDVTLYAPTRKYYTFKGWWTDPSLKTPMDDVYEAKNYTLYAMWEPNSYDVIYHDVDMDEPEDESKDTIYTSYTRMPDQNYNFYAGWKKDGYTFAGWSTTRKGTRVNFNPAAIYRNLTEGSEIHLYAVWTRNNYRITYVTNGGTIRNTASKTIQYTYQYPSAALSLPSESGNIYRANYTFEGWYLDPALTKPIVTPEGGTIPTEYTPSTGKNLTFYAKWKSYSYLVDFEDLTFGNNSVLTYNTGTYYNLPTLKNDGYDFLGWSTVANSTRVNYVANARVLNLAKGVENPDSSNTITLYAVWRTHSYTISYALNGGTQNRNNTKTTTYGLGSPEQWVIFYEPTRANATFLGWYVNDPTFQEVNKLPEREEGWHYLFIKDAFKKYGYNNITLYAKWQVNSYQVAFNLNDTDENNATITWNANTAGTYTLDEANRKLTLWTGYRYRLPSATRTGYTFRGWLSDDGKTYGAGAYVQNLQTGTYDGDITRTMTAVWTPVTYRISYNYNGGSAQRSTAETTYTYPTTYTVDSDGSKKALESLISAPIRTGYTFDGWYVDSALTKPLNVSNYTLGNITVYAKWTANNYTITFDANEGTLGTYTKELSGKYQYQYGMTYALPGDTTRTGYGLRGWSTATDKEKNKITYAATGTFANLSTLADAVTDDEGKTSITLYAMWGTPTTYAIRYNFNGGTKQRYVYPDPTKGVYPTTYSYGDQWCEISPAVRSGYTFVGWYVDPGCTVSLAEACGVERDESIWLTMDFDLKTNLSGLEYYGYLGTLNLYAKWKETSVTYDLGVDELKIYSKLSDEQKTAWNANITDICYADQNYQVSAGRNITGYTLTGWQVWDREDSSNHKVLRTYTPGSIVKNVGLGAPSVTLHAVWSLNTYKITYNTNGGRIMNYPYGEPITYTFNVEGPLGSQWDTYYKTNFISTKASTFPVGVAYGYRQYYTFENWYTDSGLTNVFSNSNVDPAQLAADGKISDITLYAKYNRNIVTMYYSNLQADGRVQTETKDYEEGTYIRLNADFTKEGYTLTGWTSQDGSKTFANNGNYFYSTLYDTAKLIDYRTLYAQWKLNNYTINWNMNGGVNPTDNSQYRSYTLNQFIQNGRTETGVTKIALTNPTRANYTFTGWTLVGSNGTREALVADEEDGKYYLDTTKLVKLGNVTLLANWSQDRYAIHYMYDYDSEEDRYQKSYDVSNVFFGTNTVTANASQVTKAGYTLVGWSKKSESDATRTTDYRVNTRYAANTLATDNSISNNGVLYLYPVWQPITYRITYNFNGGTKQADGNYPTTFTVEDTLSISNPADSNFAFGGWYTDAKFTTKFNPETTYTSNLTLYAKRTCRVTFDANGGDLGDGVTELSDCLYGTKYTLNRTANRYGYNFLGWSTDQNATRATWGSGATVTNLADSAKTSDITLYAVWANVGYSISYVTNGGTLVKATNRTRFTMDTENLVLPTATQGEDGCYIYRNGYKFDGWYISPDFRTAAEPSEEGELPDTVTNIGTDFDLDWDERTNLSQRTPMEMIKKGFVRNNVVYLYAKWTPISYSVKYYRSAEEKAAKEEAEQTAYADIDENISFDQTWYYSSTVERSGCKLIGWNKDPVQAKAGRVQYQPGAAYKNTLVTTAELNSAAANGEQVTVDLYAVWSADKYTITYNYNGGAAVTGQTYTTSYTALMDDIYVPTPVKTGYIFAGWYQDNAECDDDAALITEGGVTVISPSDLAEHDMIGNITLYARWTQISLKLARAHAEDSADASYSDTKQNKDLGITVTAEVADQVTQCEDIYLVAVNQNTDVIEYVIDSVDQDTINTALERDEDFKYELELSNDFSNNYRQCVATKITNGKEDREVMLRAYMQKMGLAVKDQNGTYRLVSNTSYVQNPEAIAYCDAYDAGDTKKGIQGSEYVLDPTNYTDCDDLNVDHVFLNLFISRVFAVSGPYTENPNWYAYNGKCYYFNGLGDYVQTVRAANANNKSITIQVMLDWSSIYTMDYYYMEPDKVSDLALAYPINSKARQSGHFLYSWEHSNQMDREAIEAAFSYIAEKLGELNADATIISANEGSSNIQTLSTNNQVYASNWILGNEVNSYKAWQYSGSMSSTEFFDSYAETYAAFYRAIKATNSGAHVYICLDQCWNSPDSGYTSKYTLDQVAARLESYDPTMEWDVAFHPYDHPLTHTEFWNTSSSIVNQNVSTPYITMKNINVLTTYLANTYTTYGDTGLGGTGRKVILSEQGYNANNGQTAQAAALVYSYEITEANPMLVAFEMRTYQDEAGDLAYGIRFGLTTSGGTTKREAYYAYKYCNDTSEEALAYMNEKAYWKTVNSSATGWSDLVTAGY